MNMAKYTVEGFNWQVFLKYTLEEFRFLKGTEYKIFLLNIPVSLSFCSLSHLKSYF